jgi:hypothetical protein
MHNLRNAEIVIHRKQLAMTNLHSIRANRAIDATATAGETNDTSSMTRRIISSLEREVFVLGRRRRCCCL